MARQCGTGTLEATSRRFRCLRCGKKDARLVVLSPLFDNHSGSLPTNETGEPLVTTPPHLEKVAKAARLLLLLGPLSEEALEMFELFKLMSDSVNTLEIHESSIKKELQYDFEKKENATKAEQEKKDIITKRELQKQKIVRNSFIVGFLFLFILALLLYRWYKQKQKANIKIAAQKQEVENQKHIVEEKQKEILDSIRYAKRIQNAILPNVFYPKLLPPK